MKITTCCMAALAFGICQLAAAEEPFTLDFAVEPEWQTTSEPGYNRQIKNFWKGVTLPIPPQEKDFTLRVNVDIERSGIYCFFRVLAAHSTRKLHGVGFFISDSKRKPCVGFLTAHWVQPCKPFVLPQYGKYEVLCEYAAARQAVRYQIRDAEHNLLHDTGFLKSRYPVSADTLILSVMENPAAGLSNITYDAEKQNVSFHSQVSAKGFRTCGTVDDIVVDSALPQETAEPGQSAEGGK